MPRKARTRTEASPDLSARREVHVMAERLTTLYKAVSPYDVAGRIWRLVHRAAHEADRRGRLPWDDDELDRVVELVGFTSALEHVGWLERHRGAIRLTDPASCWQEAHARRRYERSRKSDWRSRDGRGDPQSRAGPARTNGAGAMSRERFRDNGAQCPENGFGTIRAGGSRESRAPGAQHALSPSIPEHSARTGVQGAQGAGDLSDHGACSAGEHARRVLRAVDLVRQSDVSERRRPRVLEAVRVIAARQDPVPVVRGIVDRSRAKVNPGGYVAEAILEEAGMRKPRHRSIDSFGSVGDAMGRRRA